MLLANVLKVHNKIVDLYFLLLSACLIVKEHFEINSNQTTQTSAL